MKRLLRSSAATLLAGATLASSFTASQAQACGGFFCGVGTPVDQAAERIVFAQDNEGNVTQIVEVLYDGPAENFAWVLPVPGVPEPDVSSRQVFDRLQAQTDPEYWIDYQGWCDGGGRWADDESADGIALATGGEANSAGGVVVLDAGSVGPFDYETISVDVDDEDPADVAVRWLEENEYDVGAIGADVLRPYLSNGLNLIAFRLQKGQAAGAIRPIVLEYESRMAAIPILPTAVAAADDMPIMVWNLGAHRTVPTNYRDLEINELLIDWFDWRSSYDEVVTAAANEAGGQGFVTEFAGSTEGLTENLVPEDWEIDQALGNNETDVRYALEQITRQLGNWDGFDQAASEHLTLREGVSMSDFIRCTWNYFDGGTCFTFEGEQIEFEAATEEDPALATDLTAFRASLMENVIQPFIDFGALVDSHDYMTRLYTTMSADEMTLDPTFELNADAPEVERTRIAQLEYLCDEESEDGQDAWVVELPDGRKVYGTGSEWPYALGDADLPVNARVLQYSTEGAPDILEDNSASIQTIHEAQLAGTAPPSTEAKPSAEEKKGGCSYDGGAPAPSPWAWLGLAGLGVLAVRRRRV